MCLTFRRCFPWSSRRYHSPARASVCSSAEPTMRLRSESAGTVGLRPDPHMDQVRGQAGGKLRSKFKNLWGGHRSQAVANKTSTTDGHQAPGGEKPQNVILTFEQNLEKQLFCEASKLLREREELLFRVTKEAEGLKRHEEEVKKLADDYKKLEDLVVQTLRQSLNPASMEALLSAVRAIDQEEEQDERWKQGNQTPPDWRPRDWGKLHDKTICSMVEQRMDNPSILPTNPVEQSSIRTDVNGMGRQLKDDLMMVVEVVKSYYPPKMDICNFYAKLYHQQFSARLRKITEFVLEDKDCIFLLRWVNEFYPELLQKPQLASEIDAETLGKLIPKKLLEPLEEQYLKKQQEDVTTYISRVLKDAEEKWNKGEEPAKDGECFNSTVAFDVINIVESNVTSAVKIVGDQHKAQQITCQLRHLLERFRTFQNDIIKQNKPNSKAFIKANLGCIAMFSNFLHKKSHLIPKDVQESCLQILPVMKQSAHTYLLKPVHEVLKPQYRKLGTNDWLKKNLFEKLLDSIEEEIQDLRGSTETCHQELIGQLYQEVIAEYVKRLLRGEVKLKDQNQQLKAYTTVKDNAESLHNLFANMGSNEDWSKEILIPIAELLRLQDLPAIQMLVAMLGAKFPDLSEKHVSALLKLKTNFSKANRKTVKETLKETLSETSNDAARPFFSAVQFR